MKFLFLIGAIILLRQASATTFDEAQKALEDFDQLIVEKQDELHLFMNNQSDTLHDYLNKKKSLTLQQAVDQINEVIEKISHLVETSNKTGSNVEGCQQYAINNIQNFTTSLNQTLNACSGNLIRIGNSMLYAIWARVWDEYDSGYQCNKNTLIQCTVYERDDCFDTVIDNIEDHKTRLIQMIELLKTDMENKITGIDFPCHEMILQDLAAYLSLNIEFANACVGNTIDHDLIAYFEC